MNVHIIVINFAFFMFCCVENVSGNACEFMNINRAVIVDYCTTLSFFTPSTLIHKSLAIVPATTYAITVKRGVTALVSGVDTYTPGETLTVSFSATGNEYAIQISKGALSGGTAGHLGCTGNTRYYATSGTTTVSWVTPAAGSGQIKVAAGWANNQVAVKFNTFTLSEAVAAVSTFGPSFYPSAAPIMVPTSIPSFIPSTVVSSFQPTTPPSVSPSTNKPTLIPSYNPSYIPSSIPSSVATAIPIYTPSSSPTVMPSQAPSRSPSTKPSVAPFSPSVAPTIQPSITPNASPYPSSKPITSTPTIIPTYSPTSVPSFVPTYNPTIKPTFNPTNNPSKSTIIPTVSPSLKPSITPTNTPTFKPSLSPSTMPSIRTYAPSNKPVYAPTSKPTFIPSKAPSVKPTRNPSSIPTIQPSSSPTGQPTSVPTAASTAVGTVTVRQALGNTDITSLQTIAGISVFQNAVANSLGESSIKASYIQIISVTIAKAELKLRAMRRSTKQRTTALKNILVIYTISYPVDMTADNVMSAVRNNLGTGKFNAMLQRLAIDAEVTGLQTATVTSSPVVVTEAPTNPPQPPNSAILTGDFSRVDAAIVGVVGGIILLVVVTFLLNKMGICWKKSQTLLGKKSTRKTTTLDQ